MVTKFWELLSCDAKLSILLSKIFRLPWIWLGRQADYVLLQFDLQYFGSHQSFGLWWSIHWK